MSSPRMRISPVLIVALLAACGDGPAAVAVDAAPPIPVPDAALPPPPFEAVGIERVGHAHLDADINLGLALAGTHAYVGHRFLGEIDIVDIADPSAPRRIGGFDAGLEPTELRAIADLARLYVVTMTELVIYDLTDPVAPVRVGAVPFTNMAAHEMFLWRDPAAPARVLAFVTDVSLNGGFAVFDVSDPTAPALRYRQLHSPLHSMSVSDDGTRAYLSFTNATFAVMDVTALTAAGAPQQGTMVTTQPLFDCKPESPTCIAHSAVVVPGRDLAVVTYEAEGCPKGGMSVVDIADETKPARVGAWKHPFAAVCTPRDEVGWFGYGPHNPTVTANLALVSWYRAGFLMFDLTDPAAPAQVASFTVDVPPGSRGPWGSVASVSYPIIKDGLIYVVDGRNGLEILRYLGPHRAEIDGVAFREGNSNL